MCLLQIGITCLVFASLSDPIEPSSPDENSAGFFSRKKLPIRRSIQHHPRQSSASSSNSSQPSQLPECELSPLSDRHLHYSAAATLSASADPVLRARSRSPPGEPPSHYTLFGMKIDNLRFERFFPLNNSSRELVIRMYNFRPGTQLHTKDQCGRISEPLVGVHFILSALNGDAFALVDKKPTFKTTLRGLYIPPGPRGLRAKLNTFTHHVSFIEPEEAKDIPLGKTSFKNYFTRKTVDVPVESFFPAGSTYSLPPSLKLFGIRIEDFPFYRFFPVRNQSRELGIQLYTFSADTGIHLKTEKQNLDSEKLTGEQFTLSDMNGDAVALLKKSPAGHSIMRGLYVGEPSRPSGNRVTINIFTGLVRKMDGDEIYASPLGNKECIRNNYNIRHVGVRFAPRINAG